MVLLKLDWYTKCWTSFINNKSLPQHSARFLSTPLFLASFHQCYLSLALPLLLFCIPRNCVALFVSYILFISTLSVREINGQNTTGAKAGNCREDEDHSCHYYIQCLAFWWFRPVVRKAGWKTGGSMIIQKLNKKQILSPNSW